MAKSVIREFIKRKIVNEPWGEVVHLYNEDSFIVKEYKIIPGKSIKTSIKKNTAYFVMASGYAEFESPESRIKAFKGDKVFIDNKSCLSITNSGVIPAVIVEVCQD